MDIDVQHLLPLDLESFVGERVAVLGISGSGKTTTVAVLIEELLASGLSMTIVDTDGEYFGLKEQHDLLVAGRSAHVELPIEPEHAAALAQASVEQGFSVILDVSGYKGREAQRLLEQYFPALWDACSALRRPYEVVLEEAHVWIPQERDTPLKEVLTDIALRGRKRGLGIILASQRSAKVEKDILTQVPLLFLHQVVHPIDITVYKGLLPLPAKEVERIVGELQRGQAIVKVANAPYVVQIRPRHTFHPGSTPAFATATLPALRSVDAALLQELQQVLAASVPVVTSRTKEQRQERRIQELEQQIAERDVLIADQIQQIEHLSRLTVSLEQPLSLPETLHIAHAHVEIATIEQVSSQARVVEAVTVNSEHVLVNETKLHSLQRRLSQLPAKQYEVFKLLVGHGTAMSIKEIAAWLNIAESTAQEHVPMGLSQLGLLERTRRGHGYVYKARLKEYLVKECAAQGDIGPLLARFLS
jgi:predicted transcriptional regulator